MRQLFGRKKLGNVNMLKFVTGNIDETLTSNNKLNAGQVDLVNLIALSAQQSNNNN